MRLLDGGADRADDVGETLLAGAQRSLWRRALMDGPAAALPVTLSRLRMDDGVEPASNVLWTSAIALASSPRANVWLLGLNAGSWPRRISEDRLIPDHVLSIEQLDPLPVADGDRRDFDTIAASAAIVVTSFSRRDVGGRLLGRSPLISAIKDLHLDRARRSLVARHQQQTHRGLVRRHRGGSAQLRCAGKQAAHVASHRRLQVLLSTRRSGAAVPLSAP